jgi:hypothetical protein
MLTQTPDDVYYSPARGDDNGGNVKKEPMRTDPMERQWNMARYDRRWRYLHDFDRYYDPYRYGFGYGYYYNPYYNPYPVLNPYLTTLQLKVSPVRSVNLNSYQFQQAPRDPKGNQGPVRFSQPVRTYNQSNRENSTQREINTPSYQGGQSPRNYQPSGNSGGSPGSSISRPARN